MTVRLWRDRTVRWLLLVQWLPSACVTAAEALFVPYAAQRGFPAGSAGLLMASVPVGMLLGNLGVGRLLSPPTRERLVAPLLVLLGAPLVGFALPVALWLTAGLAFLAGVGFSYSLGLQRAFLDALDPQVRGQAFALQFTGMMTLQGVGPLVTGALAEVAPIALVVAAAGRAPRGTPFPPPWTSAARSGSWVLAYNGIRSVRPCDHGRSERPVQGYRRDLRMATSQPGANGSKPCSISHRAPSRQRTDHHADPACRDARRRVGRCSRSGTGGRLLSQGRRRDHCRLGWLARTMGQWAG